MAFAARFAVNTESSSVPAWTLLQWQEQGLPHQAWWRSESATAMPAKVQAADDSMPADQAYRLPVRIVTELAWHEGDYSFSQGAAITKMRHARFSIFDPKGKLLARWGTADGAAPGSFVAPHGLALEGYAQGRPGQSRKHHGSRARRQRH